MKKINLSKLFLLFVIFTSGTLLYGQKLYEPSEQVWKPMKDDVYLQEVAKKIKTEHPIQDVAVLNETCFALINGQVNKLSNDQFQIVSNAPVNVNRLISENGSLWALAKGGI